MKTTTTTQTSRFLRDAIRRSGKTQAQIACEAGLQRANILSMMRTGETKVPLSRIPALAEATGTSARVFLRVALAEYQPEVWRVIAGSFGDVLTEAEQDLLVTFRLCDEDGEIRMDADDVAMLAPVFKGLVSRARRRNGLT